jgi:hypothetical protein
MLTAGCTGGGDEDDEGDTGPGGPADRLLLKGRVHAGDQSLELENTGNTTIRWELYRVSLNGSRVHTINETTGPDEVASFTYDGGHLDYYSEYEVNVVENATRAVVWSRTLTAGV